MPNLSGYLNGLGAPDETPDTKKGAPDLFRELGILSPSEKAQAAQQQQQTMQLLQQQLFQQKQQQATQAASSLGSSFGFPLFTAMGGLNKQPQMPQQPQQGGGFDPGSIVAQELASTPDDRAGAMKRAGMKLMQIGGQKGDSTLQRIASNLIVKSQTEAVEQQKAQAAQQAATDAHSKAGREAASAGNPDTPFEMNMPNGDKGKFVAMKDAQGRFTGYKFLGGGPENVNQRVQQIPDDRKEYEEFRSYTETADSVSKKLDQVIGNVKDGAATGKASTVVNSLNNALGTIKQLVPGSDMDESASKALKDLSPTFSQWAQKTGVNTAVYQGLVSLQAKLDSTTGTITEKDIMRAANEMGSSFSDPETVLRILESRKTQLVTDVQNKYKYLSPTSQKQTRPQYRTFMKGRRKVVNRGTRADGTKVVKYDDGTVEDAP